MTSRIRREQVCARCRNHNVNSVLKGHKKECPYAICNCDSCTETERRRQFIAREIAFHRRNSKGKTFDDRKKEMIVKMMSTSADLVSKREERRDQMCARCRNHGEDNLIRGHKNSCPYTACECGKCEITKERRKIMAKQIKDFRHKAVDESENSQTSAMDENDSGYSTSPNNSPESERKSIEFPIPTKNPVDVPKPDKNNHPPVKHEPQPFESLRVPEVMSIYSILPPEMLNTFFMVQSLLEKYCMGDSRNKIQFVYAFVLLAHQNWPFIEGALTRGGLYADEFFKYHIQMASEHFSSLNAHPPKVQLLPQEQPAVVRVRPMNGNF